MLHVDGVEKMIVEKTYLCPMIGAGTYENPRRPRIADLPIRASWFIQELDENFCLVSVVAEEEDHQKISLENLTLIATRGQVELPSDALDALRKKYENLDAKLETAKSCSVTLDEKTGKEESKSE